MNLSKNYFISCLCAHVVVNRGLYINIEIALQSLQNKYIGVCFRDPIISILYSLSIVMAFLYTILRVYYISSTRAYINHRLDRNIYICQ